MGKVGRWDVNVTVGSMPEKVATAFGELNMVGAEYEPIAYLGSQVVNGVNHAVLAEQIVTTGRDTKNIVTMIFNERGDACTLVGIERVVESGGEMGGITVDPRTGELPKDATDALNNVLEGFVGADVKPFALLGTQITKGTCYIFAATITPVALDRPIRAALVVANDMTGDLSMTDLLTTKYDVMQLGYQYAWVKRQNSSLGAPLGEWP